jgi:hypothetical protein
VVGDDALRTAGDPAADRLASARSVRRGRQDH